MSTTERVSARPVTERRIKTVLDRHQMHYGTDDDGRIGTFHAGHLFRIAGEGGVLLIRTRWHRSVESGRAPVLHTLLRRWNADLEPVLLTPVPWGAGLTVDARAESGGPVRLTDSELYRALSDSLEGALRAFALLDRHLGTQTGALTPTIGLGSTQRALGSA